MSGRDIPESKASLLPEFLVNLASESRVRSSALKFSVPWPWCGRLFC